MPLDPRKIQHILQVVTRSFAQRQRVVVVVYLIGGSYVYSTIQAILRPELVIDPQELNTGGKSMSHMADTLMIAPLGTNFTGAVYVADTVTATVAAVTSAPKYEIIEVLPVGIIPGGSRLRVSLRRLL